MRSTIAFAVLFTLLAAALLFAEKGLVDAPVGAHSLLYLVADSQRDLTSMPSEFTRLSDEEETKIGNELAAGILTGRQMSSENEAIEEYVASIGTRLAHYAHRKIAMHVHYLPDPDLVNAFALPGGHVFIGGGLLAEMTTEDQLAAVIGHELEHVDHYHCAERLQLEAALRKIPLSALISVPVEVFRAGYSKEEELEADRDGVRLAAKGGYSATGATDVFELFARLEDNSGVRARTPQEELAGIAVSAVTGYFRSHPLAAERLAQIRTMIAREPSLAARPQRPIGRMVPANVSTHRDNRSRT